MQPISPTHCISHYIYEKVNIRGKQYLRKTIILRARIILMGIVFLSFVDFQFQNVLLLFLSLLISLQIVILMTSLQIVSIRTIEILGALVMFCFNLRLVGIIMIRLDWTVSEIWIMYKIMFLEGITFLLDLEWFQTNNWFLLWLLFGRLFRVFAFRLHLAWVLNTCCCP